MSSNTRLGLVVLVVALTLGALGDGLLRADDVGLNFSLWIAAVVTALPLTARYAGVALEGQGRWLILPVLFLASAYTWRDTPALVAPNIPILAGLMALIAIFSRTGRLIGTSLLEYVVGAVLAGAQTIAGLFQIVSADVEWKSLPKGPWAARAVSVIKGLLIALPLLLIFATLLAQADAVFKTLLERLLELGPDDMSHVVITAILTWLAAGFLRTALAGFSPDLSRVEKPAKLSLGAVEMGIVLGLLNLLFLAFVAVQFRYFFGGADLVEATTGLTYAEYARRGFFELVGVAALVLPMLLLGHWLLPPGEQRQQKHFTWLSGTMIGLLAVIMVSALQRMLLYLDAYGLTELRLYSTVFMGWLALLFGWFCLTVLRGQRNRFAFGALASGLVVWGALHLVNPDGLIVRVNAARMEQGLSFDAGYAASLSADAVPALVKVLPSLPPEERQVAESLLLERWGKPDENDWRSWNLARSRARAAVATLQGAAAAGR